MVWCRRQPGKAVVGIAAYEAAGLPYDPAVARQLKLNGVETPTRVVLLG
jgi:hypothetical protein